MALYLLIIPTIRPSRRKPWLRWGYVRKHVARKNTYIKYHGICEKKTLLKHRRLPYRRTEKIANDSSEIRLLEMFFFNSTTNFVCDVKTNVVHIWHKRSRKVHRIEY